MSGIIESASQSNPVIADMAKFPTQHVPRILHLFPRLENYSQVNHDHQAFYTGSGDQNSTPHTCVANILTTEPSPQHPMQEFHRSLDVSKATRGCYDVVSWCHLAWPAAGSL